MRKNRREEWLTEGKLSRDGWNFIEEKERQWKNEQTLCSFGSLC